MYFFGVVVLLLVPFVFSEKNFKSELLNILMFLPHIQIIPTNLERSEDYLDLFIKEQKMVPVFIGNENFSENKIITSTFNDLPENLAKYLELQGATYIYIIDDAIDKRSLEDYSRKVWDEKRIKSLFFLTKVGLFSYNPFEDNGKLYSLTETNPLKTYENLNGFPIRVQMFRSVYSIPLLNETGSIRKVLGPDGHVAQSLKEKMNFTMIFNEPNKDFFG